MLQKCKKNLCILHGHVVVMKYEHTSVLYIRIPTLTLPESTSALRRKSLQNRSIFWKFESVTLVEASRIITKSISARHAVNILKEMGLKYNYR